MAVVVVGGQCSKVGKTAVVCALIAALPEFHWTAIKISSHPHSATEASIFVEQTASDETDTGRYLAAGAKRALLISGDIAHALQGLREESSGAEMMLIESNRMLEFIAPEAFLFVMDAGRDDFKESGRRWIAQADALLIRSTSAETLLPAFARLVPRLVPRFVVGPGDWAPAPLLTLLQERLALR